jgi:HSP20 family protein
MAEVTVRRVPSRSLTSLQPYYEPFHLLDEVERIANHAWEHWGLMPSPSAGLIPDMDLYEEKGELVVKMELPGLKKDDIDISLEGDRLIVKGSKKEEQTKQDTTYYRSERCFGQFYRSVTLPHQVKSDKIQAHFENGVLEIRLPRVEARTKRIELTASKSK